MSTDRFDFEQKLLKVLAMTEDLDLLAERLMDGAPMTLDETVNAIMGISNVHKLRGDNLWEMFEDFITKGLIK